MLETVNGVYSDILPKDVADHFEISRRETKIGKFVKYQLRDTAKLDADYLDAVERGDTETAQRMVEEIEESPIGSAKHTNNGSALSPKGLSTIK